MDTESLVHIKNSTDDEGAPTRNPLKIAESLNGKTDETLDAGTED